MTLIAGAGNYYNSARLANEKGFSPSIPTLLDSTGGTSLLEAGRSSYLSIPGFGVSSNARKMNQQLLNSTASMNELFSLGAGTDSTAEGAATMIKGLRASLPKSAILPSLLEAPAEEGADNGNVSASENGQIVDEEA